jgi:predicted aldo/keto reductase-like oxidoreductase
VRHCGISCHGPRQEDQDSMEKVLCAAAEDGRFDLMLLSYNFMNKEEAEKVLATCKKHNVGTTAMKTAPGALEIPPFDPENPTGDFLKYIESKEEEGQSREQSIAEIQGWIRGQKEIYEQTKPFRDKHGVTGPGEMREVAVKWVLQNPDMHTVCVGMRDFEMIDRFVALSGTKLARSEARLVDDYALAYDSLYCRHGCRECLAACSQSLPVSTIMRYSYYFSGQGREKHAMIKYAGLGDKNAARCLGCDAPCNGACPFGVNIKANLLSAHSLLTFA